MEIKLSKDAPSDAHACLHEYLSLPQSHATNKGLRTLQKETTLQVSEGIQIWSVDLDNATRDDFISSAKPGEWHYLLFDDVEVIAEAQVQNHTGTTLTSSISYGPTTAGLVNALLATEKIESADDLEPRLLHISSINFVGLWLHSETNDDQDIVIDMLSGTKELDNLIPVKGSVFETAIKSTARSVKKQIDSMTDDFGGGGSSGIAGYTNYTIPSSLKLTSLPPKDLDGLKTEAATAKALPNFMQSQAQSNWCWAAVGTSVGLFFKTGNWTQCSTATGCLIGQECCLNPAPCNVYGSLDKSLTFTNSFDSLQSGTTSLATVESNINANKPVCTRVAWNGGGAHFMAISGYNGNTIIIQDPFYGTTTMPYSNFPASYRIGGIWTHTYFCTPGISSFESNTFLGVDLHMDGSGVTASTAAGGGTVNCLFGVGALEQFKLEPQSDGTTAIASVSFPGVYLRMDGGGVTACTATGGGIVNCQFGVGTWEKFNLEPQSDGTTAIASIAFPGVYLRMDGGGVTATTGTGGGIVNCQFGVGAWEKFNLS